MTVWIILFSVLAIITVTGFIPITVNVSYIGGELHYSVKYAGIKFYPRSYKFPRFKKSKKVRSSDTEKSPQKSNQTKEVSTSSPQKKVTSTTSSESDKSLQKDKIRSYLNILKAFLLSAGHGTKFILKGVKFTDIFIDFTVSDSDACNAAIKYGAVCCGVYNTLGFLSSFFKTRKKSISVKCVFNSPQSSYDVSFKIKLRLSTAVIGILDILLKSALTLSKQNSSKSYSKRN